MALSPEEMLCRLGSGASITSICADARLSRQQFDEWWNAEVASRVPQASGAVHIAVTGEAEILRDRWGIPHVYAQTDETLFHGFGFALAQDRLWQLDYLRRRALGRLAEVMGPEALSLDIIARTVGLHRIAQEELRRLPRETRTLLEHFASGVNACIEQRRDRLPIEFALLDYLPEPWTPLDSVAILGEFRWYLTGRLPVIAIPELAKRTLRDDALYRAFLTPEAGEESILPPGTYPARRAHVDQVGEVVSTTDEGAGSNNWVVSGARSATGKPLLASDPHIAFGSTSCWWEVHLSGGSFNSAGMAYVGVPAVIMGRNARVGWGITNNICSQRDLYQERTDRQHPGCFFYDGRWEPAREVTEEITVRGGAAVHKVIRSSRNGPIVDELLPEPARDTGPVSLRWLGAEFCDALSAALRADRAGSCAEFREALKGWRVPTWSFVFADVEGHIGYQCVGRLPIRENWDRGYRHGWDPDHQWKSLVPFDGMPALADPPSGWIRSANNRTAPADYPYPLSGTWSSGHRALRIRQMLEAQDRFSREDFARMQLDALSLRAVEAVPPLLRLLDGVSDERVRRATTHLASWNRTMEPGEVGAALFELFFIQWCRAVAQERFAPAQVDLIAGALSGLALSLLFEDRSRWFARGNRTEVVVASFRRTLDDLETRCGPDMAQWTWGRVHAITLRHFLSGRGDLSALLDRGGHPVRGSGVTVCNTGYDPNYMASLGANYRMISDMSMQPPGLWAIDAAGASGDPGSVHYCDQLPEWLAGHHHFISLERAEVERASASRLVLTPAPG